MAKAKRVGKAKTLNLVFPYEFRQENLEVQGKAVMDTLKEHSLNPQDFVYRGIDTRDVAGVRRQGTDRISKDFRMPDQPELEDEIKKAGLEPANYVWACQSEALLTENETENPIWYATGNPDGTPMLLVYSREEVSHIGSKLEQFMSEPLYVFENGARKALKATFAWKAKTSNTKPVISKERLRQIAGKYGIRF